MSKLLCRVWLVATFLLLMIASIIPKGNAEPYFEFYPKQGNVFTDIFLKIRGLPDTGYGDDQDVLYIVWEDISVGVYYDSPSYHHYFDVYFSPPNKFPYSNLGNHTVYFEVWSKDRQHLFMNTTFVFAIIEYYPPTSDWWTWWESVPDSIKANLTGPQGETGPQGIQGVQGPKGERGDTGPYPLEAVAVNLSLSAVSVIASIVAVSMFYRMKKTVH